MKISILTYAAGIKENLYNKLKTIGFAVQIVDYNRPIENQISDSDILINGLGKLNKSIIDMCPKLKLVYQIGTGIDNIDISYCTSKSIYVANVPHKNNISVAEHAIFLMIYLAKNIKYAEKGITQRRVVNVLGTELFNKNLTIVGLGSIGMEVAKRAKAFGMNIIAITKRPQLRNKIVQNVIHNGNSDYSHNPYSFAVDQISGIEDLEYALSKADFISIHTPLNNETESMIGAREFSLMKKSSYLINVSRAHLVDRNALLQGLTSRNIAGAGFDVFYEEPANPSDKLLKLDNFIYTPHIAGWTLEAIAITTNIILNSIHILLQGKKPPTVVN
jgi:D-3-phosphoglycerate dehydrogenase / 2-oxoglutarate reductase